MVIMLKIHGQSAGKDSKSDMLGYESPSTTVGTQNEKFVQTGVGRQKWISNPSLLKV